MINSAKMMAEEFRVEMRMVQKTTRKSLINISQVYNEQAAGKKKRSNEVCVLIDLQLIF
jgi:hypothetical protein